MKLHIMLLVLIVVLVQTYLTQAKLSESSLDSDDVKHVLNKRINGLWGKRLNKLWGKRSESESNEVYQYLLRELYDHAHRNPFSYPQFSGNNNLRPVNLQHLYAQRTRFDDENEDTTEN